MQIHTTSGRWKLGMALALVPALMWGVLPIALKIVLQEMDSATIAWYRFAGASTVLAAALATRRRLPQVRGLGRGPCLLVGVASVGLAGNYLFWMLGLRYVSPATAAVVIQIAPLFLAAAGVLVFKERLTRCQCLGFAALLGGLALFFNEQLAALLSGVRLYWVGGALIVLSAFSWTFYALSQKQLLRSLPSQGIMVLVYTGAALILLPGAHPGQALELDPARLGLLLFCIVNTLIAYGALSEAFEHWEASRIGAILPLSPLFTMLFMHLLTVSRPGIVDPEKLTLVGLIGAAMVVGGSVTAALGGRPPPRVPPAEG